ncbi:MAG: UDP-3-O-(3-hydroxymyristoyl)glucosamine N-acyltransferase [Pirellulales bacterium]|nr:UDP-3-O-(3-hydroxymyristoyl)glucosamine N-acyltransferase [Pirellulales bacterium]
MQATLAELAALVGGQTIGDDRLAIGGAAVLRDAEPGQISLVDQIEKSYLLEGCQASAVVVPRGYAPEGMSAIQVDDVHQAFATIVRYFSPPRRMPRIGISPQASIAPSARLGENVDVHPFAVIGPDVTIGANSTIHSGVHVMAGSRIGAGTTIFPNAVLYENTIVGPRCLIHAGAVLGAYGFGYGFVEGRHVLSAQLGNVVLGADVEIGACSTIDRGTYGPTTIGEGTKIDDLVMVAHNCRVGRHNMLCSQVGIAGSTTTGDYVVMAGQVGVRDHVHIGERAVLGAMAGVTNDVPDGARMIGIPATPEREQKIKQAALSKLPEMRRQLKQLQRAVDELVKQSTDSGNLSVKSDDEESDHRRAVA